MEQPISPAPAMPVPPPPSMEAPVSYAGFWLRFAAYFIDAVIFTAVFGVLGAMFATGIKNSTAIGNDTGVLQLPLIIIAWLYYALMESSSKQATLGKMAVGITVTDLQGQRISFGRATGRYFAKIISGIILLIGFIMAAFTEKKQALHDMIAGTLVIKK